jgi:hypothetical protein
VLPRQLRIARCMSSRRAWLTLALLAGMSTRMYSWISTPHNRKAEGSSYSSAAQHIAAQVPRFPNPASILSQIFPFPSGLAKTNALPPLGTRGVRPS